MSSQRKDLRYLHSVEKQTDLVSKLEVSGTQPSIESFAKYLYDLRSRFVHNAELILDMSDGTSVGHRGGKMVICRLSIRDMMSFFEEGLIVHFRESKV
jgi:hypothetical protein